MSDLLSRLLAAIEETERLAKAATQAPWRAIGLYEMAEGCRCGSCDKDEPWAWTIDVIDGPDNGDGERWIEFGRVDGRVTPLAHFDVNLNGDIVDNTGAIRERATSNSDIRGWIAPEVWDYLRQGEGS